MPKRLDAFEAAVKAAGGKLKDVYLVTGNGDGFRAGHEAAAPPLAL